MPKINYVIFIRPGFDIPNFLVEVTMSNVTNNITALWVLMKEQFANYIMKIITLHKRIDVDKLYNQLKQNVNPLFKKQRMEDIQFVITKVGNIIEIAEREVYHAILFHIEVIGDKLQITRNENYVDDVNSLALESILNSMFEDVSGKMGTDLVMEG